MANPDWHLFIRQIFCKGQDIRIRLASYKFVLLWINLFDVKQNQISHSQEFVNDFMILRSITVGKTTGIKCTVNA